MKVCTKCGLSKPLEGFRVAPNGRYLARCIECLRTAARERYHRHPEKYKEKRRQWYLANKDRHAERMAEWYASNKGTAREIGFRNGLKRKFGITIEQYDAMLQAQRGRCAICHRAQEDFARRFAVDHDHDTGVVRGLLCSQCNPGLGAFLDNEFILESAIEYLRKHRPARNKNEKLT